jgi:hypothetical protein
MRSFVRRNELFCKRQAQTPSTAATDIRPDPGDTDTVAVTPPPVIASKRPAPTRVRSLRMVRGPEVLWLGIVCDGPITADAEYRVGLRLVSGDSAPRRLDVRVMDGRAQALALSNDSITPDGISASADGDTVWVSLPASVLDGCDSAIAAASSRPTGGGSGGGRAHTPWVDVRL